jgi:hypothetical protein
MKWNQGGRLLFTLLSAATLTGIGITQQGTQSKAREEIMSGMGQVARALAEGSMSPQDLQALIAQVRAPRTQSETAIAVDSTGTHLVVGFNDFRGLGLNPISVSAFAYSDDGGRTWVDGGQLPTPGNDIIGTTKFPQVFGDPDVKYLGGSTFLYSSLLVKKFSATGTVTTLAVHRSTDYGHTWTGPYEIPAATNPNVGGRVPDSADKEAIDVDPDTGRVMVSWSNFTSTFFAAGGVEISVTYSDDAMTGNPPTWAPRRVVAETVNDGQGSVPRFAGNGSSKVYLAWTRFFVNGLANRVSFAVSADGGATWGAPVDLTPSFFTVDQVLGNDRVNTNPSLAVDNSSGPNRGNVYVTYANNNSLDGADVVLLRSVNEGAGFQPPLIVNSRPGDDRSQWFPYVTVDKTTGRVFVTYYDQGIADSGDLTETTFVYSDDGGASWSKPLPLSGWPFHAGYGNDPNQPNLGDYNQAVAQNNELFAAWGGNPPLVNFTDGQPDSTSFTTPDVFVTRRLVFRRISSAHSQAGIRLGTPSFADSGGDGHINPFEQIQLTLPIEDYVTNPLSADADTGLNAKLSTTTPGVNVIHQNGTYPNVAAGGTSVNRKPYRLQIAGDFVPGTRIEFILDVHTSRGHAILPFTLPTGTPLATTILAENFEGVAPGSLPSGWTAVHGAGVNTIPWTTVGSFAGHNSRAAFHQNAEDGPGLGLATRWERLFSPQVTIPATAEYATLEFDVLTKTEDFPPFKVFAFDGLFLRITDLTPGRILRSVLAEAFAEQFATGPLQHYPKHLPRNSNPAYFEDMSVWAGDSGGLQHVLMKLPGMAGSTVQLRFEYTQDIFGTCADVGSTPPCGVLLDNIVMKSVVSR